MERHPFESRMMKIAALALGIFIVLSAPGAFAKEKKAAEKFDHKTVGLQLALRDLWAGHIFWVRNVVVMTKFGDASGAKAAEDMVVKNARAIADAIIPIYGKEAGDKLFTLLAGHYGAIKEYMTATFGNDAAGQSAATAKLKANAEEIASFLNSANPKNWPKDTLVAVLMAHGAHHIAQIDAINKKDFTKEADDWTEMTKNVYTIADALSDGIVKQFPKKF